MIAWGIECKASPSPHTLNAIDGDDLEHSDPFPNATNIPAGCSFNNHNIISSDWYCRLAKLLFLAFKLYRITTNDLNIFMGGVCMTSQDVNYI